MGSKARGLADLGNVYDDGALSNRNLIINGAMQVAQRGTSATHGGSGTEDYLSSDRWAVNADGGGSQISVDVSTDAPDGFSNSLLISPDASVTTLTGGHRIILKHKIEGQNLAQWGYATASAKPLTLSFWVKSNVTGDVSVVLNATEICGQTYTINTSGAWEYKSITFPASATGSLITYDNTTGLSVDMWLVAGPAFQGTYAGDGVWTTAANTSYTQASNINLYSSASNTFQITGVQLEVGDTATPFEHPRSYGDELARCKRYYEKSYNQGTALATATALGARSSGGNQAANTTGEVGTYLSFAASKRAAPSVTIYDLAGNSGKTTISLYGTGTTANQTGSVSSIGQGSFFVSRPSGSNATELHVHFTADAEL